MSESIRNAARFVVPFIDGVLANTESQGTLEVINPSNGELCGSIPEGCEADVDRAVTSARRTFEAGHWAAAPPSLRKKVLHALADLIHSQSSVLDALDAGEMGKPVAEARFNATAAASLTRFYAESIDKVMGDVYASDAHSFATQRRVARGVVGAITPWNFPTFNAVLKLAPALAAGNSVVLKPSELSSRSAMHLASLARDAGVPPGVLNLVPGRGEIVGRALGLHPSVDMIAFTGSTAIGKQMLLYAGQSNMKAVMAECGGKSAQILFDDGVDLDAASAVIARMLLTNQGQICSAGSRLLVQKSIEKTVVEKVTHHFKRIVMGNALDPKTTFGPLVSAKQCARVMRYIDTAVSDGAELVTGGKRALVQTGGFFVEPTLFRNVSPGAPIAQEEIFGPVLAAIPFDDETDALRIANGTSYGLAAYVWTSNLSTAMRMAKGIRSSVRVNAAQPMGEGAGYANSSEPAGQSGLGTEGGLAGMESYLRRQSVWFNHA